jgi:hypothetical protein
MGASLMQQCRVGEEGFRVVNPCRLGKTAVYLTNALIDGTSKGRGG